ncbi:MAG: hypothetical protein JWO09_747 [Bacteroidetes bacterium]|nr:hypothetical protein [Bacteroidota bacterium]
MKRIRLITAYDLVSNIGKGFWRYLVLGYRIGWQDAYHDLFSVVRRLWFFFIFQVVAVLALIFLPQGQDLLQCLVEDAAMDNFQPALWLLVGMWIWSLTSEFGARMLLYLTDSNSEIPHRRIIFRRLTQMLMPAMQALFPFLVYISGLIITFIHHYNANLPDQRMKVILAFSGILLLYLLNFALAIHFYFGANKVHQRYFAIQGTFQNWMIRHVGNILTPSKSVLLRFGLGASHNRIQFRKNYPELFKKCVAYSILTVILFLIFGCFASEKFYFMVGSPAILALGIAAWLTTFYLIKVFELTKPFTGAFIKLNLPYSSMLFLWIIIVSINNDDHPINIKPERGFCEQPVLNPKEYLAEWMKVHEELPCTFDSAITHCNKRETFCNISPLSFCGDKTSSGKNCSYDSVVSNYIIQKKCYRKVPVIFICAEGGALRTGCFASLLLGGIQDMYPDFRNHILGYSTVSGGTFGTSLFNSTVYQKHNDSLLKRYTSYYKETDFFAPLSAKLMFGDFLNYFIPFYVKGLDRQVALEKAWCNSWSEYLGDPKKNIFYENFYAATQTNGSRPMVLVNTTIVETGERGVLSNVKLDTSYFKALYDLNNAIEDNFSYATAIGLSSRFPIISPGGELNTDYNHKIHILDGGYFENMGNTTLRQLLNSLTFDPAKDSVQVIPMVLQIVFDFDKKKSDYGISSFNEITEIVNGMYNTRSGHGEYANVELRAKIAQMGGSYLEIPVSNTVEEVPMNWVLSSYAVENAKKHVESLLNGTDIKSKALSLFLKNSQVKDSLNRNRRVND